jgi:toxin ParE1/3/4
MTLTVGSRAWVSARLNEVDITATARRDISGVLRESRLRHGIPASARYRNLISFALAELRLDPKPPASKLADTGDLRLYPLRFAAHRAKTGRGVRSPVHVFAYRFDDQRVQIVRLLHEAMDLPHHLNPGS